MSKIRDVDYLTLSARIHAMETRLLTEERMDRMIDARDTDEAAKVLAECGYGELSEPTGGGVERLLTEAQAELFRDLGGYAVARPVIEVFRCKYDYHNAKVLVKAAALGMEPGGAEHMLLPGGRYDPKAMLEEFQRGELTMCGDILRRGVSRARETLGSTGDPQLADFILDRAYFEELTALAKAADSAFLQGYVALLIDAANLRSAVRASRLGKGRDFLEQVLLPGGTVSVQTISAAGGQGVDGVFHAGPLAQAAEAGAALAEPGSGALTDFERLCDDAVMEYLGGGRRVAFGEQPVIGYLYAREAEMTAVRTIMSGRLAGLSGDVIRRRLRRPYA